MRRAFFTAVLLCVSIAGLPAAAEAQPSAAQVVRDLTAPGVLSVKLKGRGSRAWSSAYKQYTWDQNAVVVRKAGIREYPKATVEIGGIATYSIVGGKFPFKKFYVTYNSFHGIPAPAAKEVVALINSDLRTFLGFHYSRIVGSVAPVSLAADPKWEWHTPNSVSLLVNTGFTEKVSNNETEKKRVTFQVRLYRDAIKKPWKKFIASSLSEVSQGKTSHGQDAFAAMKTLDFIALERKASEHLKSLPAVDVPGFSTDLEMFAWLHQALRAADAKRLESILRRSLSPGHFADGSGVLLDVRGEALVSDNLKRLYNGSGAYADQYGPDPAVKHYQTNMLELWNADGRHFSRIALEPSGGVWQDGVKTGQTLKISALEVWLVTEKDELARLGSMQPEKRFAPPNGARRLSELGQQVVARQQSQVLEQAAEAIVWTPHTSSKARLRIAFPATPTETEGTMNAKYPMWTVEAKHPQVRCRAISIKYPAKLNRMQSQQVVVSTIAGLAESNKATIPRQSDLMQGTYGRLAVLQTDDTTIKVRVFVQDDILYQLIMSGSPAVMEKVNEREFFGSFQTAE